MPLLESCNFVPAFGEDEAFNCNSNATFLDHNRTFMTIWVAMRD